MELPATVAAAAAVHDDHHHHDGDAGPQQQQHPDPKTGPLLPPAAAQGQPHPAAGPDDGSVPRFELTWSGAIVLVCLSTAVTLAAAFLCGAGMWAAVDGYQAAWAQAVAMRTWPPAPAVVTVATNATAALVALEAGCSQRGGVYTVNFTYPVGGVQYSGGSAVTYSDLMLSTAWYYVDTRYESSRKVMAMLAAGEEMTAYYDPAAAGSHAFLLRDVDTRPYADMMVMGVMFGMLGVLLLSMFGVWMLWEMFGDGATLAGFMMWHCWALPATPRVFRVLGYAAPATLAAVWGWTALTATCLYVASGGAVLSVDALSLAMMYLAVGVVTCVAAALVWVVLRSCEELAPKWAVWAAAAGERAAAENAGRRQGKGCSSIELA